ncbi:MAG: hypothetical protein JWL97_2081 [Gemmatimonadales bacterium]|nr:hypothetical protein [Gemmatimonadales bacterium]
MDKYALADQTKSRNIIPLLAALWATLVAAYLYLASTYDLSVVYFGLDTSQFELVKNRVIAYAKVVAVTGPGSAFGLTIPVFLALLPLAVRKHRRAALVAGAVLTLGVCLIWPFSIGVLYLPTALLLLLAVGRTNADPAHAI